MNKLRHLVALAKPRATPRLISYSRYYLSHQYYTPDLIQQKFSQGLPPDSQEIPEVLYSLQESFQLESENQKQNEVALNAVLQSYESVYDYHLGGKGQYFEEHDPLFRNGEAVSSLLSIYQQTQDIKLKKKLTQLITFKINAMSIIDIDMLIGSFAKLKERYDVEMDPVIFQKAIKNQFLNKVNSVAQVDSKLGHSMSYFLFLSMKLRQSDPDLVKQIAQLIYAKRIPLEVESAILLLFSICKVFNSQEGQAYFSKNKDVIEQIFSYVVVDLLSRQPQQITQYLKNERDHQEKLSKLSMFMYALTSCRKIQNENLRSWTQYLIIDNELMKSHFSSIDFSKVGLVTLINLLQSLTFAIHPQKLYDFDTLLLGLDPEMHNTLLRKVLGKLKDALALQNQDNEIMLSLFAMKSYVYYEQARRGHISKESIIAEQVIKDNLILYKIYIAIMSYVTKNFDHFSMQEKIMVTFELCQKKMLRRFFAEKMAEYLKSLDFSQLAEKTQDFLNVGHILYNSMLRKIIGEEFIQLYLQNLKTHFLKSVNMEIEGPTLLMELQKNIQEKKATKEDTEMYHVIKVMMKLTKKIQKAE